MNIEALIEMNENSLTLLHGGGLSAIRHLLLAQNRSRHVAVRGASIGCFRVGSIHVEARTCH